MPLPRALASRLRSTTFRRSVALVGLLTLPTLALSTSAVDELAFLDQALTSPVIAARLQASRARVAADGTHPALFQNPSVQGRHEEARGIAGATTDAVTASWTLELGFPGPVEGRAATLQAEAGEALRRAEVVDTVCTLRRGALDLWVANERQAAMDEGHARLDRLLRHLEALATAGDTSPYELDRARAADTIHQALHDKALVETEAIRSRLEGLTGTVWQDVDLLPLETPVLDAPPRDPLLAALQTEHSAAERSLVAARRAAVPDLNLFGGTRWDAPPRTTDRSRGWEAGASLSVPLFERNQVAIAEAQARLTDIEAEVTRRSAEVEAHVLAARRRVEALGPLPPPVDGLRLWQGALSRYEAGESSLEDLLRVTETVTTARIARAEAEQLRRAARLDLSCALGFFPEPSLQRLVEETLR